MNAELITPTQHPPATEPKRNRSAHAREREGICLRSFTPPTLAPPYAFMSAFSVISGSNDCFLNTVQSLDCVTDGYGDYTNYASCTIRANIPMTLHVLQFDTESCCDKLTVGGVQYSGSSGPNGVQMTVGQVMTWNSDSSVTEPGFTICANAPPWTMGDPFPPPPLPASPPPPPVPMVTCDNNGDCHNYNSGVAFTCTNNGACSCGSATSCVCDNNNGDCFCDGAISCQCSGNNGNCYCSADPGAVCECNEPNGDCLTMDDYHGPLAHAFFGSDFFMSWIPAVVIVSIVLSISLRLCLAKRGQQQSLLHQQGVHTQQVQLMNMVQNRLATPGGVGGSYPHASAVPGHVVTPMMTPIPMAGDMPSSGAVPVACAMAVAQPVSNVELGGYSGAVPVAVVTAVPITTAPGTMQGHNV
jgi:hypothetical protein